MTRYVSSLMNKLELFALRFPPRRALFLLKYDSARVLDALYV